MKTRKTGVERLIDSDPAGYIDHLAHLLSSNARLRGLPEMVRRSLARDLLAALGVDPEDLR
jgi:hypothetical protein